MSAFLIIINLIVMTGCWGYKEINELPIVLGAAIDKISKDEYLLTIEVLRTSEISGQTAETKTTILQMTGKTVFEPVRKFIVKNGRFLYWANMKVLIIDKKIAEDEGIISVLDFLYRDIEARSEGRVIIAEDKAADIFKENKTKGEAISMHILETMDNVKRLSKIYPVKMYEVIDTVALKGKNLVLPILSSKDIYTETPNLSLKSAVFKKNKMIGTIIDEEVRSYRLLINEEDGGLRIENVVFGDENSKVTYEIEGSKTKIEPLYKDGKFIMEIDITTDAIIAEVMNYKLDFMRKDVQEYMKEQLENTIKDNCTEFLSKIQKDFDSDVLGFGELVKNKYPKVWKESESNWDNIFPNITTIINVKVNLKGSALYSKIIE
ncbi:spore germination protein B3 precursor [Clostridium homopropionicum DSM 5847]|uniref:Spore germination protein B3 n=1 Tax=Clostridium homopropionicum DSM 5847 TaxID=1121318 RepID=A0A0L6Z765_9CLOT|nr:spore germination protein B3 precursor [Clostridium homopropionicum DSM 5847]SFG76784.1 spore germination protein KC [Clostridium homopropionicum]